MTSPKATHVDPHVYTAMLHSGHQTVESAGNFFYQCTPLHSWRCRESVSQYRM